MAENKENKDSNVLYIDHRGELLIWIIIVLIPVVISFFCHVFQKEPDNEYKIFMPEVDGLIVGSPVRAMGIEIGHVIKIQPVKDEVFIKFVLTDKSVILPRGTAATVEFNGMAGSKSLELYLPDKDTYVDATVPTLTVHSPKKLSDATGLLNEMFKTIGNIIAVSSKFGTKLSEIDFPEKGEHFGDPNEFLNYVDSIIDIQQKRVDDFGNDLDDIRRRLNGRKK